jgi:predicted dithiol-disulfide oxidoreductase (DUF899 family)
METASVAHPDIVSRAEWLEQRKALLEAEKTLTKHYDRVAAQRRRLPMVKLDKQYTFDGPEGKVSLLDLFAGRRQLIVYHFMFDPDWEKGCPGCTWYANSLGEMSMLEERDAGFVMISRAPLAKLQGYAKQQGWSWPWYSSSGTSFNYDFHVTQDDAVVAIQYNYRQREELEDRKMAEPWFTKGETHGLSVFFRLDDQAYHTYSTYARGCESLTDAFRLLDVTPYGRQQEFEDSPPGWPQKPTYGDVPAKD